MALFDWLFDWFSKAAAPPPPPAPSEPTRISPQTSPMEQPTRLFMACGDQRREGFLHVDAFASSNPDVVHGIEQTPWPFEADRFEEVVVNHLARVGQEIEQQRQILAELYRVCAPAAAVTLQLPWIRHDSYWADPTHVRPYTPETFQLLSRSQSLALKAQGVAHTPLWELFGVDFEIVSIVQTYDPTWWARVQSGAITREQLREAAVLHWGVVRSWSVNLKAVKGGA